MSMKMTMAEFVGLELCPFCGGEAVKLTSIDGFTSIGCLNCNPFYGVMIQATTEAEAIAAWNSRAERTCECVAEYAESPIDGKKIVLHRCSACHELMRPHMRYCPNCGAKVVSE